MPSVITIGSFDGVHAGHVELLRRARAIADEPATGGKGAVRVAALAFDPHPRAALRPGAPGPARLTTFERRAALLRAAGADEVVRLTPDEATLGLSPEAFVGRLVRDHAPIAFVEGGDFRFGRDRAGDVGRLAELGRAGGFRVEVVPPVEVTLSDGTVARASSTLARRFIALGRARDASAILGRPHAVDGVVEGGQRRGRTLGFPTINVRPACLAPGDGVYAGFAELPGGRRFSAAISIGDKPTFGGDGRVVEAHLLGGDPSEIVEALRPLGPEGWPVTLHVIAWVRDQVRFASAEALASQIARDCARVRAITAPAAHAAQGAAA